MSAPRKNPLPFIGTLTEPKPESLRLMRKGAKSLTAAAEFLGVSKSLMKRLVRDGAFTSFVQHGKRKVPTAELVAELARGLEEHREGCK